jgi:hypothetical protein
MMDNRQVSYEVLVGDGSRWVIDSTHQARSTATNQAHVLLKSGHHKTVKVTRERDGGEPEIVFQQEGETRSEKPITISQIDDSAICADSGDLVTFAARITIGRVLRKYLDQQNLTALELLHDYGHLRDLRRMDMLFNQAVHRIASIQARLLDEAAPTRIDLLYRLAVEATDAARDAGDTGAYVKILNENGLTTALEAINDAVGPGTRTNFVYCVLAAYIGQERDWRAKLGLVLDLLEKQPDAAALVHLDELCAEIMDGADSVRDILGAPPDIATALRQMSQLATGQYAPTGRADPLHDRINRIMKRHDLPVTRDILLERVARAMSSTQPLTRESDAADRAVFTTLLKTLIAPAGLQGGEKMSEAVTRRARIVMKSGESDLPPEGAVERILALLPNRAVEIGYLLDLHRSEFGEKYANSVLPAILDVVKPLNALTDLLPENSSPDDFIVAVNDLRRRIGDDALGAELSILITQKLNRLQKQGGGDAPEPAPTVEVSPKPTRKSRGPGQRTYQSGDVIFEEGDLGDEAFMIVSGAVEISTRSGEDREVLASLRRGEFFGEMALVDDQPRMATATAIEDATVSVVPQEVFKKRLAWLAEEDRMISHVMEVLVTRLRHHGSNQGAESFARATAKTA